MYYIQETISYYGDYEYIRIIKFSSTKEELLSECESLNKEATYHQEVINNKVLPIYGKIFKTSVIKDEIDEFLKKFPISDELKKYFNYRDDGSVWGIRNEHHFKYDIKQTQTPLTLFDDFDSSDLN